MTFVTPKASFVKGNGRFCNRCKQVGHIEQYYKTNKNKQSIVSSIKFDSCYMLVKGANGVKAKFIGTPIVGLKKVIWVPKTLVANLQGPKQVWVPKKSIFFCRSIIKPEKGIGCLIVGAHNI